MASLCMTALIYEIVMWNDIDSYLDYRDFTTETTNFPPEEMKAFTQELVRFLMSRFDFILMVIRPVTVNIVSKRPLDTQSPISLTGRYPHPRCGHSRTTE